MKRILTVLIVSLLAVSAAAYEEFKFDTLLLPSNDAGVLNWPFSGSWGVQVGLDTAGFFILEGSTTNSLRFVYTTNGGTTWTVRNVKIDGTYRISVIDVGDSGFVDAASGATSTWNPPHYLRKIGRDMILSDSDLVALSSHVNDSGAGSNSMNMITVLADSILGVHRFNGGAFKSYYTTDQFSTAVAYNEHIVQGGGVTDSNPPPLGIASRILNGIVYLTTAAGNGHSMRYYGVEGWDTVAANIIPGDGYGVGRQYNRYHLMSAKGNHRGTRLWLAVQRPCSTGCARSQIVFFRIDVSGSIPNMTASLTDSVVVAASANLMTPIDNDSAKYTLGCPRIVSLFGTDTLLLIRKYWPDTSDYDGIAVGYHLSTDGGATWGAFVQLRAADNRRIENINVSSKMDLAGDTSMLYLDYTVNTDNADGASTDTLIIGRQGFAWPAAGTPTIAVSADTLFFVADSGAANPAAQVDTVTNTGTGSLSFTIADDSAWLEITPTTGTDNQVLSVSVDVTNMPPGTYWGSFTITDAGATNSPYTVYVRYIVNDIIAEHVPKYVPVNRFR